jgi:geranylgeranylglycerol-phosphate geranylgeranyltransferase
MHGRSVSAFAALMRWPNALLAAAGVAFGAWWVVGAGPGGGGGEAPTGGESRTIAIALAVLAAVSLTAVANAWNDAADVEIDALAHPERPLPSGVIGVRSARRLALGSAIAGIALATVVSPWLGALTVAVVALMLAYSPWIKHAGFAGNMLVAVLASLPFLYGGWAAGSAAAALPLVAIAIPLHLAREIAKDLEDAPADAATRRTLPVTAGRRIATAVLIGALIVFLLLLVPYIAAHPVLGAAAAPAIALLLYAGWASARGRRGAPGALKLAMVCTMAAFLFVRF